MSEIWHDVVGYEGLYQISNFGNVKSLNYNRMNLNKNLKLGINLGGYFYIGLYKNNISKKFLIARLVAEAFIPNPCNKSEVNHIDYNKINNKASNLEWVTHKENIIHSIPVRTPRKYVNIKFPTTEFTCKDFERINNMPHGIRFLRKLFKNNIIRKTKKVRLTNNPMPTQFYIKS